MTGDSLPLGSSAELRREGVSMEQPGLPAGYSMRERKLFPLPFFACPSKKAGFSRAVQQRAQSNSQSRGEQE